MILDAFKGFDDCVLSNLAEVMERLEDDLSYRTRRRIHMGITLENRTCHDVSMNSSSDDEYNETWVNNDKKHLVHVKLDRPASKVHVIDDFISVDECRAVEQAVAGRLGRAIVADGKGGATQMSSRKSLQAIVEIDWSKEAGGDITANLFRRVYNYTNHVLGLNIQYRGQEPPAVIEVRNTAYSRLRPSTSKLSHGMLI
jgi:hypothetical protein